MEDRTQQQHWPDGNCERGLREPLKSLSEEALLPPRLDRVVVKKYDPKRARLQPAPVSEEWLVSPITGEKIPANKLEDHMRIGLLDPRWLEQRDRTAAERTDRDDALAPGAAIEASLKQLAERRTDIFGVGDEETAIGKKIGEEERRRDERVTWDGHTSSVEAATRAARAHITLEDQIQQIHKVKGLLPDEEKEKIGPKKVSIQLKAPPRPPPRASAPVLLQQPIPPMAPRPPLIPTPVRAPFGFPVAPPVPRHEPAAKRPRTEDTLEPEGSWLARHPRPVTLQVLVPLAPERAEWRLDGRALPLSLPLATPVADLKALLQRSTNMPTAKQKLHYEGLFFKDTNTLAYYNVPPGAVIHLQVKERGGRKK